MRGRELFRFASQKGSEMLRQPARAPDYLAAK
jgi:hypothetical protein